MKKLKDFAYNQNDLLVVLLILLVAAVIITGRMRTILDYPAKLTASSLAFSENTEEKINDDINTEPGFVTPVPVGDNTGEGDTASSGDAPGEGNKTAEEPAIEPVPDDTTVTFTIKEGQYEVGTWRQLAMDLQTAGVIDDWHNFLERASQRASSGTLGRHYPGTYTLTKGTNSASGYDTIINQLNRTAQ